MIKIMAGSIAAIALSVYVKRSTVPVAAAFRLGRAVGRAQEGQQ